MFENGTVSLYKSNFYNSTAELRKEAMQKKVYNVNIAI